MNKKYNSICAWLFMLAMLFGLFGAVSIAAGAEDATLTVTAPASLPAVGQTFTVEVSAAGKQQMNSLQFTLTFDKTVVSCKEITPGALLEGFMNSSNPNAADGAIVAAASAAGSSKDGTLAVMTFQVLSAGDVTFGLRDIVFADSDGTEKTVAVVGATSKTNDGKAVSTGTGSTSSSSTAAAQVSTSAEAATVPAVTAEPEKAAAFTDVKDTYWAKDSISEATEKGLVQGYSDGTFRPENPVTRAQFVTMLWRMAQSPATAYAHGFADVKAGEWYEQAVAWAAEKGYVSGVKPGRFDPDGKITRQQAMAILFRLSGSVSGMETMMAGIYQKQFTDYAAISKYAEPAVLWAVYKGIVSGVTSTTIAPEGTATRAQIAVILLRYMEKMNI